MLPVSMSWVDSGEARDDTPKLVISSGSICHWKASLLRGETCQVSWWAWISWVLS